MAGAITNTLLNALGMGGGTSPVQHNPYLPAGGSGYLSGANGMSGFGGAASLGGRPRNASLPSQMLGASMQSAGGAFVNGQGVPGAALSGVGGAQVALGGRIWRDGQLNVAQGTGYGGAGGMYGMPGMGGRSGMGGMGMGGMGGGMPPMPTGNSTTDAVNANAFNNRQNTILGDQASDDGDRNLAETQMNKSNKIAQAGIMATQAKDLESTMSALKQGADAVKALVG